LIRALEPANHLTPHLHGDALNRLREGACPPAKWPWPGMTAEDALKSLWQRVEQIERRLEKFLGPKNS
jgi:hypothetical protein